MTIYQEQGKHTSKPARSAPMLTISHYYKNLLSHSATSATQCVGDNDIHWFLIKAALQWTCWLTKQLVTNILQENTIHHWGEWGES